MKEAPPNRSHDKDNQPDDLSCSTQADTALADIQAAMMEELGISRKDMLPLQDVASIETPQYFDSFPNRLKPKGFVPGVDIWRNAVFDDVNPAEEKIDSIADGQLARIRRNLQNQNNTDFLPSKRGHLKSSSSAHDFTVKGSSSINAGIREGKGENRDKAIIPSGPASFHRNSTKFTSNSSNLSNSTNGERKYKNQVSRTDFTIARLRAANPAPGASRSHTTFQKSTGIGRVQKASQSSTGTSRSNKSPPKASGKTLSRQSSQIEVRTSRKVQQTKTVPDRTPPQNSVWGSLDENAFLAFAIKPLPPPQPHQPQNSIGSEKPITLSSNISSSSGWESSPSKYQTPPGYMSSQSGTEDRNPASEFSNSGSPLKSNQNYRDQYSLRLEQSCEEVKSKLTPTEQHDPKESIKIRDKMLPCNRNLNESLSQTEQVSHPQRLVKEAKVIVQKDADLGQPGIAKLNNEQGLLLLELQQNSNIVVHEPIHDETVFVTDPMNSQFMVIYQGAMKGEKQTWRICFDLSQDKSIFMEMIIKFRVHKKINGFGPQLAQDAMGQPYSGKECAKEFALAESSLQNSTMAECTSLLDNLEIEKPESDNNLIHIGNSPLEKATNMSQLSSYERRKIETFNDLAEIGDINLLSSVPEKPIEQIMSSLQHVDDDILIEFLYHKISDETTRTELHHLLEILGNQKSLSTLSMTEEDTYRSKNYILSLNQKMNMLLGKSELFKKLPGNIADQYVLDKTQRVIEKAISKLKDYDPNSNKMLEIATKLSTSPSDYVVNLPLNAKSTTTSGKETNINLSSPSLLPRITYSIDDLMKLRGTAIKFNEDLIETQTLLLSNKSKSAETHYIKFHHDKDITPSELSASTINSLSSASSNNKLKYDKVKDEANNTQIVVENVELPVTQPASRRVGLMSSRWCTE